MPIFQKGKHKYKVIYGGRGSGKSWSVAKYLVIESCQKKHRILCTRENQNRIKDSVYKLLVDQIHSLKLEAYFEIFKDAIRHKFTGSEFIFKGLRHNIAEIKSTEGITIVWCEEAEKISKDSWEILIPTIRTDDAEFLITFNPEDENAYTYQRFVISPSDETISIKCNWSDNKWFPEILRREKEYDKINDYEKYMYVWEGYPKKYGQAVIFKNKLRIEEFDPPDDYTQLYYGADFGFGVDPTCLIRLFIRDRRLYIDKEFYGYGVEIDDMPRCWDTVPGCRKWRIICDSARPDTVSYMYNHGFQAESAEKGQGSVEDGIEFLKNFECIIIHPSCTGSIGDFSNYRWKVDKITDEVLPVPVDKSNHACDAARYALEPYMKAGISIFDALPRLG